MKKIQTGATTALLALLLVFSLVVPVNAHNGSYIPDDPVDETPQPEATPASTATPEASNGTASNPDNGTGPVSGDASLALANPVINVWYENELKFGVYGTPQTEINILGNVSDDGSVSSLSYRLNSGSSVTLEIGADSRRLAREGDFNVSIPTTSLVEGTNTIVFTAQDNSGGTTTKTITFPFSRNNTWPIPYTTNWAVASSIYDQAQVVDGLWQLTGGGVRVVQQGYDRLIAIGDVDWTNFEVLVPITIHQFYPVGDDRGGVGIIARWQGHYGTGQPPDSWDQLGAYAYYSNRYQGLALRFDSASPDTTSFSFSYNRTYMFRLRAETVGSDGRYSFKVWEKGQSEPSSWQFSNSIDEGDSRLQGSLLLVAHRADATFGDVTVCPLSGVSYTLNTNVNGQGSVSRSPNKSSYNCGESVTLTASAPEGWVFSGWSGDVQSSSQSATVNVTRNMNVTANFSLQNQALNHRIYIANVQQ